MRVKDERIEAIFVERDPARSSLEVQIGEPAAEGARVIRLTGEEARRLAALLLFEAGRLERTGARFAAGLSGTV